jgi:hypothetical protein
MRGGEVFLIDSPSVHSLVRMVSVLRMTMMTGLVRKNNEKGPEGGEECGSGKVTTFEHRATQGARRRMTSGWEREAAGLDQSFSFRLGE